MRDFKSNVSVAGDNLLAIVDEVRSSTRNVGSLRSSRFDQYMPQEEVGQVGMEAVQVVAGVAPLLHHKHQQQQQGQ
eukprot:10389045-Karenia_brevis.AAC.1